MEEPSMKNPMIENNINTDLFEAIDEHAVNGGIDSYVGKGDCIIISFVPSARAICGTVVSFDSRCLHISIRTQCSLLLELK